MLEVISDDEDYNGGIVFKRRRAARASTPPTASLQGGGSFKDHPLSATSPPPTTVQEERGDGAESAPPPLLTETPTAPTSAPAALELITIPPPIRQLMRGFNGGLVLEGSNRREGMPYYMGAFLAIALDWRAQAQNTASNARALQALKEEVAALKEKKEVWERQDEAYQASLKLAQEAKEGVDRQLDEALGIPAELYVQVVSLQVQITDLEDMTEASKEHRGHDRGFQGASGGPRTSVLRTGGEDEENGGGVGC